MTPKKELFEIYPSLGKLYREWEARCNEAELIEQAKKDAWKAYSQHEELLQSSACPISPIGKHKSSFAWCESNGRCEYCGLDLGSN